MVLVPAVVLAAHHQTGVAPPFVVVMNKGDMIFDANSVPIGSPATGIEIRTIQSTQFLKTASAALTMDPPPAAPAASASMIVFGDGHAIVLAPLTKIQVVAPVYTPPNLDGSCVYVSYGQATLVNVDPAFMGYRSSPTQVIIKTKATTTAAKGTTVSVSVALAADGGATTTTVNYQATQCLLFQGDRPTSSSPATSVPVGGVGTVQFPNPPPNRLPVLATPVNNGQTSHPRRHGNHATKRVKGKP